MSEPIPDHPDNDPAAARRLQQEALRDELLATRELFDAYDWGEELLTLSLDDPAVAPILSDPVPDDDAAPLIDDWDVMRLVDDAAIGRALERGETILQGLEETEQRDALLALLDRFEGWSATPIVLGFWWRALEEAVKRARAARSEGEPDATTDGVDSIESAAKQGGPAGVRAIVNALARAEDPAELSEAARNAFAEIGEMAEELVPVFVVREPLPEEAAAPLYRFSLDIRAPVVTERLVRRAVAALAGVSGPDGAPRARLLLKVLADSADPRGIPLLAVVLRQVDLAAEDHQTLVAVLQELELWPAVSEVLAGFKGKAPRLVPNGVSFEAYYDRMIDVEGVDRKSPEALRALRERAATLWLDVYREECGWLRTRDVDVRGPGEESLGKLFEAEATYLLRDEADDAVKQERAAAFHQEWTRKPSRASGGRPPLAVILGERIEAQPAGPMRREMRRRMLGNLVAEARSMQRQGARTMALGNLDVIADLAGTDYPPASRLRRDLG